MGALAIACASAVIVACGAAGGEPQAAGAVVGCGKDTDCKGERLCVDGRCVFPEQARPAAANAPTGPGPAQPIAPPLYGTTPPTATPLPAPPPVTTAQPPAPPPPAPRPSSTVSSGEPGARCGCGKDDLMCHMKCAQKDNAAGPSVFPKPDCGCAKADLMCKMRCSQRR